MALDFLRTPVLHGVGRLELLSLVIHSLFCSYGCELTLLFEPPLLLVISLVILDGDETVPIVCTPITPAYVRQNLALPLGKHRFTRLSVGISHDGKIENVGRIVLKVEFNFLHGTLGGISMTLHFSGFTGQSH